jgi:hypothetical protein
MTDLEQQYPTEVFIKVDVKDELPENNSRAIFISSEGKSHNDKMDNALAPEYYVNKYTHWLKLVPLSSLLAQQTLPVEEDGWVSVEEIERLSYEKYPDPKNDSDTDQASADIKRNAFLNGMRLMRDKLLPSPPKP